MGVVGFGRLAKEAVVPKFMKRLTILLGIYRGN